MFGELGNRLGNYTSPFPVRAADALNQPNTLIRVLPGAEEDSRVRVLGNGRVRISIPNDHEPRQGLASKIKTISEHLFILIVRGLMARPSSSSDGYVGGGRSGHTLCHLCSPG